MNFAVLESALDRFLARTERLAIARKLPVRKTNDIPIEGPLPREREFRRLYAIMDAAIPGMRSAFLRAVAATQDATVRRAVADAIDTNDIATAIDAIPWESVGSAVMTEQFMSKWKAVFDQAGGVSARIIYDVPPFEFAIDDPRALAYIEEHGADLVEEIGDSTRQALRGSLVGMITEGLPTTEAAKLIVDQIGLTDRMTSAVNTFRRQLIDRGVPRGRAAQQAARYTEELRRYRANTIARTEAQFAASAGQDEAWAQAADEGLIDADVAVEVWITAEDEVVCDTCAPMDGQEAPLGEEFETPDGEMIDGPPAHPSCRCSRALRPTGQRR